MSKVSINQDTPLFHLAWPIFIETLLFMVMGNIDTFMLSHYSDLSVAAVGNANQMLGSLMILFNVATAAAGVMVAQYLGAKEYGALNRIYSLALWSNVGLAAILSALFIGFKSVIYSAMQLPSELLVDTNNYATTMVWALPMSAAYMVLSTIHKNHGMTRLTMQIAIVINILNIIGNYIFLYGPFGLPIIGVQGVALSTVISRSLGLVALLVSMAMTIKGSVSIRNLWPFPKELAKRFFHIGLPSAAEPISFQFSQVFIFAMINTLGTASITARLYASMVVMFTYLFALAIAQATQILTGHLVGAQRYDEAQKRVWQSLKKAWAATLTMSVITVLFRFQILGVFTDNPEIIALGAAVLLVDLFLEWGRATNITLIFSMRSAGDVHFPVIVGVISMWGISTLGAYLLGIHWGYGLVGIWMAMAVDEMSRGVIMVWRWRSGKWKGKRIVPMGAENR